jgi:Tol biopolymer transport system component
MLVALSATVSVPLARATFPGDNGRIAFVRRGTIQTMRADGTKRRRLTRDEAGQTDSGPAFSPGGKRIAFVRDFFRGPRRDWKSRIYIVRANGSHVHRVKPRRRPRPRFYYGPAFSPGGKRIVFEGCRRTKPKCALFTVGTDGTRLRRLTAYKGPPRHDSNPTFSPNGTKIAFDGYRGLYCNVYVMRADGTDVRDLTNNDIDNDCDGQPSFSPDGGEIAFTSDHESISSDIYLMRADGTDVRQLTTFADRDLGASGPSFSPNGKRIAFTIYDEGSRTESIGVMRAGGTEQRRLVGGGGPDWGVRP